MFLKSYIRLFVFVRRDLISDIERKNSIHYDAEVYPNRHWQIYPMRVSRVRFYYVNTLKVQQYCGK